MREELKRCNFIGSPKSIYEFAGISLVDYPTNMTSVISINSLNSKSDVKAKQCVALFEELNLLSLNDDAITANPDGISLTKLKENDFDSELAKRILAYLIEFGYIRMESISYLPDESISTIKRSGFPLSTAVFRNLLLDLGALRELPDGNFAVISSYEVIFEEKIAKKRATLTLEELLERQKAQERQGRLAEEYVVQFEKKRLLWGTNSSKVKQISDIDVMAGYDIVSYQDNASTHVDRFIEVKSYHSSPSFFWSENEINTAKRLGLAYYLYLVDMDKYMMDDYKPYIVCNPSEEILQSENWLLESASIKVTQV